MMQSPLLKRLRRLLTPFELLVLAVTTSILVYQLWFPPIVGLADNGDFGRMTGPLGLQCLNQEYYRMFWHYINRRYLIVEPFWHAGYISSETALVWLALVLTKKFWSTRIFDIRLLSGLHMLLLVTGIGMILVATRRLRRSSRILLAGFLVLILTDVGYVASFNSLYSQTASMLGLVLLAAVVALTIDRAVEGRAGTIRWMYWPAAAIFLLSKPQESVQAPVLALLGLWLIFKTGASRRIRSLAVIMTLLFCLIGVLYFRSTPMIIARASVFFAVFDELLPNSPRVSADLRELGLPAKYSACIHVNAYDASSWCTGEDVYAELLDHVSFITITKFYLRHPSRVPSLIRRGAPYALIHRDKLGNFEWPRGPRRQSRAFSAWSNAKAAIAPSSIPLLGYLLLLNTVLAFRFMRGRELQTQLVGASILTLVVMSSIACMIPLLAESGPDLRRHWYSFHLMSDALFVLDVLLFSQWLSRRFGRAESIEAVAPQEAA